MKMIEWLPEGSTRDVPESRATKIVSVLWEWYKCGKNLGGWARKSKGTVKIFAMTIWPALYDREFSENDDPETCFDDLMMKFHIEDKGREYSIFGVYGKNIVTGDAWFIIPNIVSEYVEARHGE